MGVRSACLLLIPLLVAVHLQRGAAEAHHNLDAPLTLEAPFQLLPCDLALSSFPGLIDDPLEAWRTAAATASTLRGGLLPPRTEPLDPPAASAPDSPRAPPRS